MKKFIIMGLTLFAFALVGCGKETEKEKCEKDNKKEWKDDKCVDKDDSGTADAGADAGATTYTIANPLDEALEVSSGDASVSVEKDKCVTVTASQWAALKAGALCDNSDKAGAEETEAEKANNCPEAGNYNVAAKADGSGNELVKAEKAAENCAELKKADAPAADAPAADAPAADAATDD